jgi:5-methylcytosine-specific restriction endonuclease McrA
MDKKTEKWLKYKLRELSVQYHARNQCIKDASTKIVIGKTKKGEDKTLTYVTCAQCKELFRRNEIEVDHIVEIGPQKDIGEWVKKLFCPISNLQCLCIECHKRKTAKKNMLWRTESEGSGVV